MKHKILFLAIVLMPLTLFGAKKTKKEVFPDGTPISDWFRTVEETDINKLGKHYLITDYDVINDSNVMQTEKLQNVIDHASESGGGVIIIPEGTFLSGSLFFKPGTHLHIKEGGKIKGSDDISDFKLHDTRIEGQSIKYFAALINADGVDGFTISGKGAIDGNGLRYWKAFWLRRGFNPQCTNLDEMRPRLLFVSNSNDVQISGVHLMNSPFWTSHYYKCENLKIIGVTITAPQSPVKAPSSDAIDIDVCKNVLIKDCFMSVNDDAVALKGGKGPNSDKDPNNGMNENIIIEDCEYGFCHGALTLGSESIHNRNIILRRIKVNNAKRLLWFKMRPDTPQNYEYILVEDIEANNVSNFLYVRSWTQFFNLEGGDQIKMSYGSNLTMRNIKFNGDTFFNVALKEKPDFELKNFHFENLDINITRNLNLKKEAVENFTLKKVKVNGKTIK